MHGRKRVGVPPPTIEEKAASKKKVDIYKRLNGVSFKHRASRTVSREALELISQLLSANPDVYTLWNYAREQILVFSGEVIHESVSAMNDEEFTALIKTQLGVAAAAIKRNSKSYPAWYHRKWLVGKYHAGRAELGPIVQLREELALCSQMLTADERNFHCWNYRRWVASLTAEVEVSKSGLTGAESGNLDLQASEVHKDDIMQSELRFTDEKIEQNFSNYSAWHSRTHLLQRKLVDLSLKGRIALVSTELGLVHKAVFTEPDDQSAWFYRRWVVGVLLDSLGARCDDREESDEGSDEMLGRILAQDLTTLRQLSEAEPLCKWPVEARAHLITLLKSRGFCEQVGRYMDRGKEEEEAHLYTSLESLDPRHAQYYRYMASKLKVVQ